MPLLTPLWLLTTGFIVVRRIQKNTLLQKILENPQTSIP